MLTRFWFVRFLYEKICKFYKRCIVHVYVSSVFEDFDVSQLIYHTNRMRQTSWESLWETLFTVQDAYYQIFRVTVHRESFGELIAVAALQLLPVIYYLWFTTYY